MSRSTAALTDRPIETGTWAGLTRTVPREFVHRAAVAEVLLTDWEVHGAASFTVRAQWPRGHAFFTPLDGRRQDPLLLAETIRQAGLLVSHAEFGVPLNYQFLMSDLSYDTALAALAVSDTPTELELQLNCRDIRRRGTRLTGMRYDVAVLREGAALAHGQAGFTCLAPAAYRRIRGEQALGTAANRLGETGTGGTGHGFAAGHGFGMGVDAFLPPAELPRIVGRTSVGDVVISPSESGSRLLRVDQSHPTLFDHPVDHVPGMVLLEAARQFALAELHPLPVVPTGMQARFQHYVEFDQPCVLRASTAMTDEADLRAGITPVLVTGYQADEPVFDCLVTTRTLH
ncbi:ScbA/BarX family gamma-butyrolactone biosynthesis protein [Streptacidiphilus sp. EB129]|uniref:ScbA/BarX family gamma-butyrolactone biosynthesis protein n=1 Tax=Streptacidiphilus sp. EB129 TaxID=3156262 RepID=UPI0035145435